MKRAFLLVFFPAFFFLQSVSAQRVIWSEEANNRIRSGNLTPASITNPANFVTGLSNPRNVEVDQINNRLYYHNHSVEDILIANLTTGAPISTLVSTGAMAGYYDFSFSDNAGVVFATGIDEVEGVFTFSTIGGPNSALPLGPYDSDVFYSVAVDDDNEYLYLANSSDGAIYRTGFSGGSMTQMESLTMPIDISHDRINNDLYIVDENSGYDIYRLDLDGGALVRLYTLGHPRILCVQAYPQFGKIYYSRSNDGIYSIDIDGTGSPTKVLDLAGAGDIYFDIVEDHTPPVFIALSPVNNALNISTTPALSLTFDENIKISPAPGVGNDVSIRILRLSDNAVVQTLDRSSPNISIAGSVATITGTGVLDPDETYYVLIGNRVFSDLSGNNFTGIITNSGWRLQTIPGVVVPVAANGACVATYSTLATITITETHVTNFKSGTNQTLVFTLSASGYAFNPSAGTVMHTPGRNVTASSISVTSTTVTVTYSVAAQTQLDELAISGLQITSDNSANPDVNLIRSGGTGAIDGLTANTVIATVGSLATPAAPVIAYPAGEVFCIDSDVSGVLVSVSGTALKWFTDAAMTNELGLINGLTTATGPDLAISSLTSQVFTRFITQSSGGCESLPAMATITIDAGPQAIVTDASPNTVCDGTPNGAALVTDVNGEGLTNYTVNWYDNAFVDLGITGPMLDNIAAGEYNALVTSNVTGCSSYAATTTIPDNIQVPVILTSSTANTHCQIPNGGLSAVVQAPVGPLGDYAFTWYNGPDTDGDLVPGAGPDRVALPAGPYTVIARYLPTGCISAPSTVTIIEETVHPDITMPSGEFCESSFGSGSANVNLTSMNAEITGGNADLIVTWYDELNNPVTNVTVTSGAQFTFAAVSQLTGCATTSSLEFTVFAQPTPAIAGIDKVVCGSTTVLDGNMPVYGIGSWSILSGVGGTVETPSSNESGFHGIPGNTYQLQWETFHVAQCPVSTSTVTITLNALPTNANAGSDQAVCDVPAALAANTPVSGTGEWSIVSGTGGSFDDVFDPATSFFGVAGNAYQLRWTISNGSCTPSASDITITVAPPPTAANAGTDLSICGNTVTLGANTPSVGTGSWSILSGTGGSFVSMNNPTTSFSGTSGGKYTLRWTVSNPGCVSVTDDVDVEFVSEPTVALAGLDQEICGATATLAANVPVSGIGGWSIVSGSGGALADPAVAATSFTGSPGTSYVLRWSISSGPDCAVSTDDVVILMVASPSVASAGTDATVCDLSTAMSANMPTVGAGQWSVISGSGGNFANPVSPTSGFSGIGNTTYQLRWTISNGVCPHSSDDVSITLITPPTVAVAGADQSVCASGVNLSANVPATGTGSWSVVGGTGGTFTSTSNPATGFSGTIGTVYTLRWTIAQDGCPSSTDEVSITLNSIPLGTGIISGTDPLCEGTSTNLTVSGISGADAFNWSAPVGLTLGANGSATITALAESGTGGNVTVTPTNGCGNGVPINAPVTILVSPAISINLPDSPFPEDPVTFSFNSNVGHQSISWNFGDGGVSADPEPVYAYGIGGEYTIILAVRGDNGCEGSDSRTLIVRSEPDLDDTAIKNVITANGDDKNRYLHIMNLDRYPENEVRFLDRWGAEVFSASNYENNWDARGRDGQFLPAGQYICVVKLRNSGKVISRTVSIIKGR